MNKTVQLNKYNNSWYKPGNKLKIVLWYFTNQLILNTFIPFPSFFKRIVLKLFGAKIGANVVIKPNVNIKYPWFLEIGENTWIGEHVWIDNLCKVTIGKNACLSQGSMLLTGNHDFTKETFDLITKEIILEDGVWIGAKAVVCPGVLCQKNALLTVNSVASTTLNANTIYRGNPAIPIKERIIS